MRVGFEHVASVPNSRKERAPLYSKRWPYSFSLQTAHTSATPRLPTAATARCTTSATVFAAVSGSAQGSFHLQRRGGATTPSRVVMGAGAWPPNDVYLDASFAQATAQRLRDAVGVAALREAPAHQAQRLASPQARLSRAERVGELLARCWIPEASVDTQLVLGCDRVKIGTERVLEELLARVAHGITEVLIVPISAHWEWIAEGCLPVHAQVLDAWWRTCRRSFFAQIAHKKRRPRCRDGFGDWHGQQGSWGRSRHRHRHRQHPRLAFRLLGCGGVPFLEAAEKVLKLLACVHLTIGGAALGATGSNIHALQAERHFFHGIGRSTTWRGRRRLSSHRDSGIFYVLTQRREHPFGFLHKRRHHFLLKRSCFFSEKSYEDLLLLRTNRV